MERKFTAERNSETNHNSALFCFLFCDRDWSRCSVSAVNFHFIRRQPNAHIHNQALYLKLP